MAVDKFHAHKGLGHFNIILFASLHIANYYAIEKESFYVQIVTLLASSKIVIVV